LGRVIAVINPVPQGLGEIRSGREECAAPSDEGEETAGLQLETVG
jgi:hypothetical protein